MTSIDAFGRFRPLTIGFDRLFEDLDRVSTQSDNYPPYNLIKVDEDSFFIELAVAGFSKDEITIEFKDRVLTITGDSSPRVDGVDFIHKGISERNFIRKFTLAEHIVIKTAKVNNGLLVITLDREIPEEDKPQIIKIK
jgi:molecular chaperone IbpA